MKKSFLVPVLVPALLLLAGAAYATHWGETMPLADCEGWSFEGYVQFNTLPSADVEWEVTLTKGTETVCTYSGTETVYSTGQGSAVLFSAGSMWCEEELCGDFNAYGTFFINASPYETAYLDIDFTCECDEPEDPCNFTQGYWKNHEEAWPVMYLTLGGYQYSQSELLDIFNTPPKGGNAWLILAHQTIAAMLNVANGSDDTMIADAIDDANDWLAMYSMANPPAQDSMDRTAMVELASELDDFNNLHCEDEEEMDVSSRKTLEGTLNKTSGAQDATWGAVKGLY